MPPAVTMAEADFIIRLSGLGPGARVLDVPCGSGRHTLELARRGYRVTGLDVSAEAIEFARTVAAAQRLPVDLRLGDMRTLPTDVRADAAICMGNAFGYLDHAGTRTFLADLAALVTPGGTLILDYGFVAEALLPHLTRQEPPMTFGGVEAVSINEYDTTNSRWLTAFTFRRGTVEHRGTSVQHVYTAAETARLVTQAGFTGTELYGDTEATPFRLGSPRLLLVARRPVEPPGRWRAAASECGPASGGVEHAGPGGA
ncbi:MAG TPA: class I SAM-dependent methyltransferase [Actinophytocola sp.]|uniref:SAM-dependent methyltransferase n=1 Tax=Actinophytocola sp. TaxID=1872138 RepID=UPI002DBAF05B|nr:class I SAM-dependent methyltransferase [Actinophytocola sp.]HEU5469393.1 class I SAM-dependent methyltransferase [Actinophytocola sp.]